MEIPFPQIEGNFSQRPTRSFTTFGPKERSMSRCFTIPPLISNWPDSPLLDDGVLLGDGLWKRSSCLLRRYGLVKSWWWRRSSVLESSLNILRKETDAGKLLGAWSIVSGISGSVVGPILFSMLFVKTVDTFSESIFVLAVCESCF